MAFVFAFGGNVYYWVMGYGDPESTQFQLRCLHICLCMRLEMYFAVFTFVWARTTVEEVLRKVK